MSEEPIIEEPIEEPAPRDNKGVDINLLPERYRRPRVSRKQILITGAILIATAVALPLYLLVNDVMATNSTSESALEALNQRFQLRRNALSTVDQLEKKTVAYQNVITEQGTFTAELDVVFASAAATGGIVLSSVSLEGEGISIVGTATDANTALAYRAALQDEWGKDAVKLNPVSPTQFVISVTIPE